jgi:hypothetical protein
MGAVKVIFIFLIIAGSAVLGLKILGFLDADKASTTASTLTQIILLGGFAGIAIFFVAKTGGPSNQPPNKDPNDINPGPKF